MAKWFKNLTNIWSQDMAIDLGTANTLVVLKGQVRCSKLQLMNNTCHTQT